MNHIQDIYTYIFQYDKYLEDASLSYWTCSPLCPGSSNSRRVSFDPLALLLDASLEGELELVKKTATEVADASAANDEGITGKALLLLLLLLLPLLVGNV